MVFDPFIEDISIFFAGVVVVLVMLLFVLEIVHPESTRLAGFMNFWRGFLPLSRSAMPELETEPGPRRRREQRGRTQIREEEGSAEDEPSTNNPPRAESPPGSEESAALGATPPSEPQNALAAAPQPPQPPAAPAPRPPLAAAPPRASLPERKPGGISADASVAKALERIGLRAPVGTSRKPVELAPAPLDEVLQRLGVLVGTLDQARELLKMPRISWVDPNPSRVYFPEEGGIKLDLDAGERNASGERQRPFSTTEGATTDERERMALTRLGAFWLGSPIEGDTPTKIREQVAARGGAELSRLCRLFLPEEGLVDTLDAVAERAVELLPVEVSPEGVRIRAAGAISERRLTVTRSLKRVRVFAGTEIGRVEGQPLCWTDSPPQEKAGTVWFYTLWYNPRTGGPARAVADLTVTVE